MDNFKPIEVDFIINSAHVKAESDKVKQNLIQIGYTAEEAQAKVDSRIKSLLTNDSLKQMPEIITATGNAAAKSKTQWNGLGNSINQITRELPSFALSAQTGFLAISNNIPILADEIGRLQKKNDALIKSGQKTTPVWQQVAKGFFSWGTALSAGVVLLTVYGREFVAFIGKLLKGKATFDEFKESIKAVNKAFDGASYKKAITEIDQLRSYINLAKDGFIDKDVALKKYNDTLGKVYKSTNSLAEAEQIMIAKAPAYIEAMLYKAAAAEASAEAAKNIAENEKAQFELEQEKIKIANRTTKEVAGGYNPTSAGSVNVQSLKAESDTKTAQKEIDQLDKDIEELKNKSVNIVDNLNKKAAEIAKNAGLNIFGGDGETDKNKTVSQYQSLLDKLTELDKEYSRKSYTEDEEELQALKDKFSKIRTLVQRYNADPKNKAQLIDLSGLNTLEGEAIESLTFRQDTDKLKEELTAQKKLFDEFETYKKQFGIAAAEKEYADKIQLADNYYDYLKTLKKDNETAFIAVENGTATGGEIERVNFINTELAKAASEEKKLFNEQLASLLSYQQKRNKLIETYQDERAKLIEAEKTEAVAELDKQHKEELENLDDANIKKLESYKELFRGIAGLSTKEVKQVLENAKQLLKALGISAELKASIAKKIAEIEKLLSENKIDAIYQYAQAIGDLGTVIQDLGNATNSRGLADIGGFLSGIAKSAGEVLTVLDTMGGGKFSDLSSADKANVITSGISGAITLIGVFASAAQKRKEAEEAYYLSVIGFQNEYNLSLQEQIRLRSILDENVFLKDYEGRIKDALSSLQNANEEYEKSLQNLIDNGKVKTGQRNAVDWGNVGTAASGGAAVGAVIGSVIPGLGNIIGGVAGAVIGTIGGAIVGAIGGLFGGSKKKDVYGDLLTEYPELIEQSENGLLRINTALAESLLANDLVNKKTAQILQNILDWNDALEEARAQIKEVITDLTGSLGTDLKTALVDAFVSGEDAAIKMGETIEGVLENILSSLIFNNIFDEAFTQLEEQMAASFDLGGDGTWVDDFSRFFTEANGLTDQFNQAMEAAQAEAANFGFDVFKDDDAESSGLTGAIRRELTEETGSELTGLFRGQYDITKRHFDSFEAYFEAEKKHHNSVLNLITINTNIEQNTANTVARLNKLIEVSEDIASNTKEHYMLDLNS